MLIIRIRIICISFRSCGALNRFGKIDINTPTNIKIIIIIIIKNNKNNYYNNNNNNNMNNNNNNNNNNSNNIYKYNGNIPAKIRRLNSLQFQHLPQNWAGSSPFAVVLFSVDDPTCADLSG